MEIDKFCSSSPAKILMLIFTLVLIPSCARKIPQTYEIENPGYLLLSIASTQQKHLYSFEIELKKVNGIFDKSPPALIRLCRPSEISGCDSLDFVEVAETGVVVAKGLTQGRYTLSRFRISTIKSHGGVDLLGTDTSIDFEIKPGKTSYLGQYLITDMQFSNREIDRFKLLTTRVQHGDRLKRDFELAKIKFSKLSEQVNQYSPDIDSVERLKNINHTAYNYRDRLQMIKSDRNQAPAEEPFCGWWC